MTKLLSLLFFLFSLQLSAQPAVLVVRSSDVPDTCKVGVDTVDLGKLSRVLVLAPSQSLEAFDVNVSDTAFHYAPGPLMVRYRLCYKVKGINSNCPWLSFQRYTPTKCE